MSKTIVYYQCLLVFVEKEKKENGENGENGESGESGESGENGESVHRFCNKSPIPLLHLIPRLLLFRCITFGQRFVGLGLEKALTSFHGHLNLLGFLHIVRLAGDGCQIVRL